MSFWGNRFSFSIYKHRFTWVSSLPVLRDCHKIRLGFYVGSFDDGVFPHSSSSRLQPITCCCLVCWCACRHSTTLSLVCADLKAWRGLRCVRLSCRALLHREREVSVHSPTQRHHSTALSNVCTPLSCACVCFLTVFHIKQCRNVSAVTVYMEWTNLLG